MTNGARTRRSSFTEASSAPGCARGAERVRWRFNPVGGPGLRTRRTGWPAPGASRSRSTGASGTRSARSTANRAAQSASAGATQAAGAADARVEAVAQRVRKLNERIIEESKSAGEATLGAYEKALKAIASSLERGPGKSDVEWVSTLATTQAKWIRDVTTAWTSAARGMLK